MSSIWVVQVLRHGVARECADGRLRLFACARHAASFDGYLDGRAPASARRAASRRGTDFVEGPSSTSISRHASSRWSTEARTWSSSSSATTRRCFGSVIRYRSRTVRMVATLTNGLPSRMPVSNSIEFCWRRIGQRCADLDAAIVTGHLQLPAGVVVTVAPSQQHAMRLKVAVGRVVVGAAELDGAVLDLGAGHDVVEAGQRVILLDIPLQFAFQQFLHAERLPANRRRKTPGCQQRDG